MRDTLDTETHPDLLDLNRIESTSNYSIQENQEIQEDNNNANLLELVYDNKLNSMARSMSMAIEKNKSNNFKLLMAVGGMILLGATSGLLALN